MDETTEARLARLAERRRGNEPASGRRRRHAAEASRVLAAGISASAFMGAITGIALNAPSKAAATTSVEPAPAPATVKPRTVVRVRKVPRVVYVDQYGRPIGTQVIAPSGTSTAVGTTRAGASNPSFSAGSAPANVNPAPGQTFAPPSNPTANPSANAPAMTPATPTQPAAGATAPPSPVATAPPATPAPPTTTPAPPPPTTLPKCTGSKCP